MTHSNSFGHFLRIWRTQNHFSQMHLADLADTTSRYISYLENGKSRPGREIVLRLAAALNLTQVNVNRLLESAGFPPQRISSRQLSVSDSNNEQFNESIQRILASHAPYPACASDTSSRILFANTAFETLLPGLTNRTEEQSIDDFFGPNGMRTVVENWAEIAWYFIDRRNIDLATSGDPRVKAMAERAMSYMKGIPRPEARTAKKHSPMAYYPVFLVGGTRVSMYATVLRNEVIHHSDLEEIRLTFFHPNDEDAKSYFHKMDRFEAPVKVIGE
ncbi:hypothetical protein NBRC116583_21130 [Arenicella sp. 4NH20-0111]|uniref:helix-turn-helix domain-containing protein n=1 Tax=Arenicella sp. 4NH20-0111 TaxID=3127648 RepID=UPI00310580D6